MVRTRLAVVRIALFAEGVGRARLALGGARFAVLPRLAMVALLCGLQCAFRPHAFDVNAIGTRLLPYGRVCPLAVVEFNVGLLDVLGGDIQHGLLAGRQILKQWHSRLLSSNGYGDGDCRGVPNHSNWVVAGVDDDQAHSPTCLRALGLLHKGAIPPLRDCDLAHQVDAIPIVLFTPNARVVLGQHRLRLHGVAHILRTGGVKIVPRQTVRLVVELHLSLALLLVQVEGVF
mmetsp:Transcript_30322/g.51214  ORF Transcript_30322/g.51214 Transcript_30322/m.51214 type:complete len:231 (+) Transcript_30322:2134-2826(+)